MVNQEELQQKYAQFQMLQQQLEEVNRAQESAQEQRAELDISIKAVEEITKTPIGNEFLAPLANGIFLKGQMVDNQKLVVNVGSEVTVERTPAEVIKLLQKQQEETLQQVVEIQAILAELNSEMMKIYQELQGASPE
ncbi:MAG: prefoldin subunit alpha [Candidatus Woesearchaeota archaeon]